MIRLPETELSDEMLKILADFQKTVDSLTTHQQQVAEGKRLFKIERRKVAFRPIMKALRGMCSGARRCYYCEDSQATDVEHIWPKDFYPDLVFVWENYLYACSRCNTPKSNTCEIYVDNKATGLSVRTLVSERNRHPPVGDPVLINPRLENPMDFMRLDLRDTFYFVPSATRDTQPWERADHTIKLLKLNDEDVLPAARRDAYENYLARIEKYIDRKSKKRPPETLDHIAKAIKRMGHPTVWHEMKRQRSNYPEIEELFTAAPEALTW